MAPADADVNDPADAEDHAVTAVAAVIDVSGLLKAAAGLPLRAEPTNTTTSDPAAVVATPGIEMDVPVPHADVPTDSTAAAVSTPAKHSSDAETCMRELSATLAVLLLPVMVCS